MKALKIITFIFILLPVPALAGGTFYYINGIYDFHFNLANLAFTNTPGAVADQNWETGGSLTDKEWGIDCATKDGLFAPKTYYEANYMTGRAEADGWQYIDEYWSMKAKVYIGGKRKEYVQVPFYNEPNGYSNFRCNTTGRHLISEFLAISNTDPLWTSNDLTTGSKGNIVFQLKKKIVNGYSFLALPVVSLIGYTGEKSTDDPFIAVYLDAFEISLPEKCEINAGQTVDIDFGNLYPTMLNGSNYAKDVNLNVKCGGGDFDSGLNEVSAEYIGTPTFSDQYFGSDNDKIAIMAKDQSGKIIKPGDKEKLPLINGENNYRLTLSPISNEVEVDTGEFSANIIIRLNLE